eukprot:85431-Pyramimonas_sp.AAC.2
MGVNSPARDGKYWLRYAIMSTGCVDAHTCGGDQSCEGREYTSMVDQSREGRANIPAWLDQQGGGPHLGHAV